MKLLYIYDALCGWCYGFSEHIRQFEMAHKDEFKVEVYSGGMVTGDRVGPIGQVAAYIADAYQQVEKSTGVKFGKAFLEKLEEGTQEFNSLPSGIAMTVFKSFNTTHQLAYAADLQKAVYLHGKESTDYAYFAQCAEAYGINKQEFLERCKQEKYEKATLSEYQFVNQLGVQGFPTTILIGKKQAIALARGFIPNPVLEEQYQKAVVMLSELKG